MEPSRQRIHMNTRSLLPALATLLVTAGPALAAEPAKEKPMQKVLGIGGLFFRSEDPDRLAKWYETQLGISLVPKSYEEEPWQQEAGPTAFAPFPKDTTYFGRPEQG